MMMTPPINQLAHIALHAVVIEAKKVKDPTWSAKVTDCHYISSNRGACSFIVTFKHPVGLCRGTVYVNMKAHRTSVMADYCD